MDGKLSTRSQAFLDDLEQWAENLKTLDMTEIIPHPEKAAVLSVDVINGFCTIGPLASNRVAGIVNPIASLFQKAWDHGVKNIVLLQDAHEPDAVEFGAYPPHCVRGTAEADTVDAFRQLPFFDQITVMLKNSTSSFVDTDLPAWIAAHPEVDTFILVGDCTDICVYQLAIDLRTRANGPQLNRLVIVPANVVNTYERSLETAKKEGGLAHPGDLMHAIFLYHMALNGIEVVKEIK
jgi:nicotinamidase-related amidase